MTGAQPMFPLGTVLLPYEPLALRIFEPRYREMLQLVLATEEKRFGVVLIERGMEVGGGDTRAKVGTAARVMNAELLPNGMWGVLAFGVERFAVDAWVPDDPFPRALAHAWPDPEDRAASADEVTATIARLRRLLGRCAEAGVPAVAATAEFAAEADVALWQACGRAPLTTYDRYRLLAAPDSPTRMRLLGDLLEEADALVSHRLRG